MKEDNKICAGPKHSVLAGLWSSCQNSVGSETTTFYETYARKFGGSVPKII